MFSAGDSHQFCNNSPSCILILFQDENSDHLNHIEINPERIPLTALEKEEPDSPSPSGSFNVSGKFLGFTRVRLVLSDGNDQELMASQPVDVKVRLCVH